MKNNPAFQRRLQELADAVSRTLIDVPMSATVGSSRFQQSAGANSLLPEKLSITEIQSGTSKSGAATSILSFNHAGTITTTLSASVTKKDGALEFANIIPRCTCKDCLALQEEYAALQSDLKISDPAEFKNLPEAQPVCAHVFELVRHILNSGSNPQWDLHDFYRETSASPVSSISADGSPDAFHNFVGDSIIRQVKLYADSGENLMLVGPKGSGKTLLSFAIAKHLGCDDDQFIVVQGHEGLSASDLKGGMSFSEETDKPVWRNGAVLNIFVEARKLQESGKPGKVVAVLDEISRIPTDESNLLVAATGLFGIDQNKYRFECATTPNKKDRTIVVDKDRILWIGTSNIAYAGMQRVNTALFDRFAGIIEVNYMPKHLEVAYLANRFGLSSSLCERLVSLARETRNLEKTATIPYGLSTRSLVHACTILSKSGVEPQVLFDALEPQLSKCLDIDAPNWKVNRTTLLQKLIEVFPETEAYLKERDAEYSRDVAAGTKTSSGLAEPAAPHKLNSATESALNRLVRTRGR